MPKLRLVAVALAAMSLAACREEPRPVQVPAAAPDAARDEVGPRDPGAEGPGAATGQAPVIRPPPEEPTAPSAPALVPAPSEPTGPKEPGAGSAEAAKPAPAKPAPAKTEPAKTEPAKTEPAKTEPAKTAEPAKPDPAPEKASGSTATAHARVGPQKCRMCHRVEHDSWAASAHAKAEIDCETCHGNGGDYWPASVMRDRDRAVAAGLVLPDVQSCRKCHPDASAAFVSKAHATKRAR